MVLKFACDSLLNARRLHKIIGNSFSRFRFINRSNWKGLHIRLVQALKAIIENTIRQFFFKSLVLLTRCLEVRLSGEFALVGLTVELGSPKECSGASCGVAECYAPFPPWFIILFPPFQGAKIIIN